MKQPRIVTILIVLALIVSACGGEKSENKNENPPQSPSASLASETTKAEESENKGDSNALGQVEVIGEKTKKIGRFEITLESGTLQEKLTETNGNTKDPQQDQIMVMKGKVKLIKGEENTSISLLEFFFYEPNETNMDKNYIGYFTGILGEDLESDLNVRYGLNEEKEGYFYFDVQKRDAYRVKYLDHEDSDYWDVKITK